MRDISQKPDGNSSGQPPGDGGTTVLGISASIDTESLLARCVGKRSFALNLLSELEATGAGRVVELARLASNADFAAIVEAAHSLKGAAAILAAEPLRALAAAIEAAATLRAEGQLAELIRQLGDEMQRCLNFIPVFRANPNGR